MESPLLQLAPQLIWQHFYQLTRIPRPSHHEEQVQAHLLAFGERLGLETSRDEVGNILIRKPASMGAEAAPGIVLQGHLDMVPQANSGQQHDFVRDPIETLIDGEWVTANGTTLGADNGIGVAAAMAVLESTKLLHGPIEALFTANEEDGMSGAFGFAAGRLQGRILMNMDSEDEGVVCIGCAGGANVTSHLTYQPTPLPEGMQLVRVELTGLKGGHSGVDIHRGRGNANKLMFRLLQMLQTSLAPRLCGYAGGDMRNAIPREAFALLAIDASQEKQLQQELVRVEQLFQQELAATEPDLSLRLQPQQGEAHCLEAALQQALIDAICVCPNGVVRMSDTMPGLVESSTNLSIVEVAGGQAVVKCLVRSSVDSARDELCSQHQALFRLLGCDIRIDGEYPGWRPNMDSRALGVMRQVYREIFDTEAEIGAIHAGLECGILGGAYPDLDMISFGPTIRYPHSPDERMHIPSVKRFWDLLVMTLARLAE